MLTRYEKHTKIPLFTLPSDNYCLTGEPLCLMGILIMENTKEIWKDVPGYEGLYQVSNLGRVKSLKKEIILKSILRNGYQKVNLYKKGCQKSFDIHVMVSIAFLNHIPCGLKYVIDHINTIKTDNKLSNLQIITHRENITKDFYNKEYKTKYIGVSKPKNKYVARISINGKRIYLGSFKTELEASIAYQKKLNTL